MKLPLHDAVLARGVLGRRMLWRSFWSILLVSVLVMAAQTFLVMQQKRDQRFQAIRSTIDLLQINVANAAWQVSESEMFALLGSLVALDGVDAVSYADPFLNVQALSPSATAQTDVWSRCERTLNQDFSDYPIGSNRLPSGTMKVCFNSPDSVASLMPGALVAALPLLALIVLASVFPAILVRRMVIQPIEQLTDAVRNAQSVASLHLNRPAQDKGDEIELLIEEIQVRSQRLLRERSLADLAFESFGHGMAVTDERGTIQRHNTALVNLLGETEPVLIGRKLGDLLPSTPVDPTVAPTEFTAHDGRILEASASPLRGEGTDRYRVHMVRDLTERKRMEALEQQGLKMSALGTLSSGVAHDFNNLLMAIGGNAELLMAEESLSEDGIKMLTIIRGAAKKGATLTSQLLSFARKQQLKVRPTLVSEVVADVVALSRRTLGSSHRLLVEERVSPIVMTDPVFLETALLNLLVNARDAQPEGGDIQILVDESPDLDGHTMVGVSVLNGGPAIPPEVLARMGEPFFTTKVIGKGTGLGLSMVMGFAQQTGGALLLQSKEGETRICIQLRVAQAEAADPSQRETFATPLASGESAKILVVDDDPDVRETLARMVERLGHSVTAAASVDEVQALWNAGARWDSVLCDVLLEGHSGLDVYRFLHEVDASLHFCFVSGKVPDALAVRLAALEHTDFLAKPISIDDLRRALDLAAGV